MRLKHLLLLLFIFPLEIFSQPFIDIISANYQYNPANESINKKKNELTSKIFGIGFNLPLKIDSDYIALNPSYENQLLKIENSSSDLKLQSFSFALSWLHQWKNQKWKTAFVFVSRMNEDDASPHLENNFQFGGAILNVFKKNDRLKYKFGFYYNSEFFGPFFLPLVGIDWNATSKLNIFGVLPGSMNVEYKFLPNKFHGGISFRAITSSYKINDANFLKIGDNHLRLFFDTYFSKNIVLSIEGGHSLLRKYKTGFRSDDHSTYFNQNVSESYLLKASLAFRIRTDQ